MPTVQLSFHGAARTVTGSKHLLRCGRTRVLLDAGLFQGRKELRRRNWFETAFQPSEIDHVLLSHTHIDHVGFLPRLVKQGMRAPVHCTPAAFELAELMLLDSAKIQEEDARHANKHRYSRHDPALPLYDTEDAMAALALREKQRYNTWIQLDEREGLRARFLGAGHILGSAFIELRFMLNGVERSLVYSGDVGRFDVPLHLDPRGLPACDALIVESTYGARTHDRTPLDEQVGPALRACLESGCTVLVPAFAVGRSQQITLIFRRMMKAGVLPEVPIHIDSPMAINATRLYSRFLDKRNLDEDVFEDGRLRIFPEDVHFHRTVRDSKLLNNLEGPRIIVSSSGMLTAGRVLHHLKRLAPDPKNLVLLAGYQAPGTRSRAMLEGADTVKVHGAHIPVRARALSVRGLSGHADREELLTWIDSAPRKPQQVYLVHGESDAAESLGAAIRERFGCRTHIPHMDESVDLAAAVSM